MARTLQRSLLPAELPDIPGVELAARYLAAGDGNEVGGDFYDCFATGAGDWALVIGDVCGKGAEAAALTALARYTLRAAALHTRRPQRRARRAQRGAAARPPRLPLLHGAVRVAHPARGPRVGLRGRGRAPAAARAARRRRRSRPSARRARCWASSTRRSSTEQSVELAPGDALVLYTDGVTEADRGSAPGRLAAFLAGCAGADAAAIAEAVERDALEAQGGHPRDDVAVVAVRVRGGPGGVRAERFGVPVTHAQISR